MPDSYRLNDIPKVGGIKSMLQRISAKITELENAQDTTAFHVVTLNGKTVNFYATSDTTLAPVGTFTIPEDKSLDQLGTEIVPNFAFSSLTYPGATNPNLDGKTVFVLAVKGDDALNPSIKYNFVDASSLVDEYTASDTSVTISGYKVKINIDPNSDTMLTLTANGLLVDGSGKVNKVTGGTAGDIVTLTSDGGIADSTFRVATDAEFTAMLDEVFPSADNGGGD